MAILKLLRYEFSIGILLNEKVYRKTVRKYYVIKNMKRWLKMYSKHFNKVNEKQQFL